MFVAMNRLRIRSEYATDFEKIWRERQDHLQSIDGFMQFWVLRSAYEIADGITEFVLHTKWLNQEAYLTWTASEALAKARSVLGRIPPEAYIALPEVTGYELVAEQMPGHRTDYRSTYIDKRVENLFAQESPEQKQIFKTSLEKGLPPINIGAFEGRMLEILLKANNSRFGIEIGTLGAYSTSWLARGVGEKGRILSIEKDAARAELARENLRQAKLDTIVEVHVGKGLDVLANLKDLPPLDFVFIDADKQNYGEYLKWAIPRLRRGGLILADNAYLWGGMNYYGIKESDKVPYPAPGTLDSFDKKEFAGMSDCWTQLRSSRELASLIFPTGEGLGVAIKI